MPTPLNLVGQQFGRLIVKVEGGRRRTAGGHSVRLWLCVCSCKQETFVSTVDLRSGDTRSCGCLNDDARHKPGRTRKHGGYIGDYPIPEMRSYTSMKQRCLNPKATGFKNYGKRGIKICDRWLGNDGFKNFLADMGPRPAGKSLDRFPNNDGNYEPGNVRWATAKQQRGNRQRRQADVPNAA